MWRHPGSVGGTSSDTLTRRRWTTVGAVAFSAGTPIVRLTADENFGRVSARSRIESVRECRYVSAVDALDPGFCMYDDPDVPADGDADKWSPLLRVAHRQLWSKALPTGGELHLARDLTIEHPTVVAGMRLSSDTIASTHQRYRSRGMGNLFARLSPAEQKRYDRGFYAIGGFAVFPCHSQSINQLRGTRREIDDRFDLTLECIRLFYNGTVPTSRKIPSGTSCTKIGRSTNCSATVFEASTASPGSFTSTASSRSTRSMVRRRRLR